MNNFYLTVGLPASGKSTFCERLQREEDVVWLSSDKIREELCGDVECQERNSEVFQLMLKRTVDTLKDGKDVIYDATNINSKRRINLLKDLQHRLKNYNICYKCFLFIPTIEECLKRNANRERQVPYHVIMRMYKSFQPPHISEGWNKVSIETIGDFEGINYFHSQLNELKNSPHYNFHHSLTIGEHMIMAGNYALELRYPLEVIVAAYLHDIGKPQAQRWEDARGNVTVEAHYYGHECVSAYEVLSHRWQGPDFYWIYIANLIWQHMLFFQNKEAQQKVRERYGSKFWIDLSWLHNCDKIAH